MSKPSTAAKADAIPSGNSSEGAEVIAFDRAAIVSTFKRVAEEREARTAAFPNLASKMAWIQGEMRRVKKNGYNAEHRYNFATESDIVDHVRALLAAANVSVEFEFVPESLREEEVATRNSTAVDVSLEMEMVITNGDEPLEVRRKRFPGNARDWGDKGVYKAMTGAKKYALILTFFVSTGDDPEHGGAGDAGRVPRNQQNNTPQTGNVPQHRDAAKDFDPENPTYRPTGDGEPRKPRYPAKKEDVEAIVGLGGKNGLALTRDGWERAIVLASQGWARALGELSDKDARKLREQLEADVARAEAQKAQDAATTGDELLEGPPINDRCVGCGELLDANGAASHKWTEEGEPCQNDPSHRAEEWRRHVLGTGEAG